ncbi:hypothetical protein LTR75_000509 [Friedmanniomyces endolithicus]|nr:hypothetical protein LTR75_000509 [Friedmanniomyces endolithicus]
MRDALCPAHDLLLPDIQIEDGRSENASHEAKSGSIKAPKGTSLVVLSMILKNINNHHQHTPNHTPSNISTSSSSRIVFAMALPAPYLGDPVATRSASSAVFGLTELFEPIAAQLSPQTLFHAQRVSKSWQAKISGSALLRRKLCLQETTIGPIKYWLVDAQNRYNVFIVSDRLRRPHLWPVNCPPGVYARRPVVWNDLVLQARGVPQRPLLDRVLLMASANFRVVPLLHPQHVHFKYADMYLTNPPVRELRVYWGILRGWWSYNLEASDGVGVSFEDLSRNYIAAVTGMRTAGKVMDLARSYVEMSAGAGVTEAELQMVEGWGAWPSCVLVRVTT